MWDAVDPGLGPWDGSHDGACGVRGASTGSSMWWRFVDGNVRAGRTFPADSGGACRGRGRQAARAGVPCVVAKGAAALHSG